MYLRGNIDDNHPHQQHWCDSSWLSSRLILIDIVVILIIWDDNENIIVAYRTASSVVTPLAVTATLIEMFWRTTTFWKECHTMCLTVCTISRNQHTLTLNQNCIDVQQSMSPHLIWQNTKPYKQNIHTEQHKNASCLREVSVLSELLLINKENWIFISSCKSESDNICIVKNENPVSCQLQNMYLYDTYIVVVVDVVAAELVVWESVLTYSIKRGFTYKSCEWRSWRRKKKKSCTWGEGFYNSLHWWINSSELSEKTTQAMKNFHLQTLSVQSGQNTCQQTLTTIQQSFQRLRAQPWRKRKRWCHELNSY